jgi:hypothetical protein
VIAMTMPITTNTTIAIWVQIQVGDILSRAYRARNVSAREWDLAGAGRLGGDYVV